MGLHTKLAEVYVAAARIPKAGTAPAAMGGYAFVTAGDVADVIRAELGKRGITMLPTGIELLAASEHETAKGGTMTTETYRVTWTLADGESGETAVIQSIGTGADTGDKAAPKAQTNAMKYALLLAFLLSTGDDPEAANLPARRTAQAPRPIVVPREPGEDDLIEGLDEDETTCAEHDVRWTVGPGGMTDRWHRKPEGGICRHPQNVRAAR
jgi:hypothetical protein